MNAKRRNLISEDANIFLIGMMGSGKSTVSPILAEKLGFQYVDLDALIEERYGKTVQEIVQEEGEEAFREIEGSTLVTLDKTFRQVIACGGGTPCHQDNLTFMEYHGLVIYLKASPAVLAGRLGHDMQSRPLLAGQKTNREIVQRLTDLLLSRESVYQKADFIVNAEQQPDRVVAEIMILLERTYPDISPGSPALRKKAE